ncbi:MAG: hypothetical protein E5Y04_32060 [Mesorhizobium sp.]|nr:MAG: hypothetical protein E5Y04_32060 [Mesorhizobium sp.]
MKSVYGTSPADLEPQQLENWYKSMDRRQKKYEREHRNVGYHRSVTIKFPMDGRFEFNIGDLTVPCRQILTWAAKEYPDISESVLGIRDQFYAGDEWEDHNFEFDGADPNVPTREDLAIKRVERAKSAPERAAKARDWLEDGGTSCQAEWDAFAAPARKAVAEQRLALQKMDQELDLAWEEFIVERENWTPPQREKLEAASRAKLDARAAELHAKRTNVEERYEALLSDLIRAEKEEKAHA